MVRKGTFYFADVFERTDRKTDYYYDDSWFNAPSSVLDPHLRTMSLNMSMAFFPSARKGGDYRKSLINAEALLGELGFDHFRANDDYYREPDIDSIGIGAAHKYTDSPSGKTSLILICFRGAGYGNEWASNIFMGSEGPAEGFARGRDMTLDFLSGYLKENRDLLTEKVRYWISGYSRVAAVANLLGAWLYDHCSEYLTSPEDIFTYTFESPLCADCRSANSYPCIHNTVNPFDMVPRIPPKEWGFIRYGLDDTVLPAGGTEMYDSNIEEVKERLGLLNPYIPYAADSFTPTFQNDGAIRPIREYPDLSGKKRPEEWWYTCCQDEYLDHFISFMGMNIARGGFSGQSSKDDARKYSPALLREEFCKSYQDAFAEGARVYMGTSWDRREGMRKTMEAVLDSDMTFRQQATMYVLLYLDNRLSYRLVEKYFGSLLEKRVRSLPDPELSIDELRAFGKIVNPMVRYFIRAASKDVRYHRFAYLSTLMGNLDRITAAHCPEVTLAWLQTLDDFYD